MSEPDMISAPALLGLFIAATPDEIRQELGPEVAPLSRPPEVPFLIGDCEENPHQWAASVAGEGTAVVPPAGPPVLTRLGAGMELMAGGFIVKVCNGSQLDPSRELSIVIVNS